MDGDLAAAARQLRALGMRVAAATDSAAGAIVEGTLPASALTSAAALDATHAILPVSPPVVQTGSVLSQGDAVIHGPAARALGALGLASGVGIISDSFSAVGGGAADSESTGDLSAPDVTILHDDPAGADEGRAMAEIVHDEAPLASIAFSSGDFGPVSKAAAIDGFAGHANIIADDIVYPGEPFFQDDVIAQAVDRARARGTAYFAAAGNQRGNAWQGSYSPVPDPTGRSATTEDFDPGPAVDTVQTVGSIPAGGDASIFLQWAEPWGGATDDFAVDVYQITGGVPSFVYTVDSNNISTGIPEEVSSLVNNGGSAVQFGFAIRRVSGSGTPLLKYIGYGDSTTYTIERGSNSGAIGPDAASARGAMTVAATRYSTPTTPEPFSSQGPVVHYFDARGGVLAGPDVRPKPSMAAPDGVATSVPGFGAFYGTSAAAPAAAGHRGAAPGRGRTPDALDRRALRDHVEPVERARVRLGLAPERLRCRPPAGRLGARAGERHHTARDQLDRRPGDPGRRQRLVQRARAGDLERHGRGLADRRPDRLRRPDAGRHGDHVQLHRLERRRGCLGHRHDQARLVAAERAGDRRHRRGRRLQHRDAARRRVDRVHRERCDLGSRELHRQRLLRRARRARADGDRDERRRPHLEQHALLRRLARSRCRQRSLR